MREFWRWARLAGGAAIVVVLLWRLGTTPFLDGFRVIDGGTVLAAAGIGALTTVASAWRWQLVGRALGIRLPLGKAVADYYQALFLNAALPGGVLGDVGRAVGNGRETGDVGRGVRAVVLERAAGQLALVAVAGAVLLTDPLSVLPQAPLGPVAAGAAAGVALLLGLRHRARRAGRATRWGRAWDTATGDVRRALLGPRTGPGVLLASLVVLAGHVATFVVAARAAGSTAGVTRLAPLALLALLAMAIPLNVGGWGPREGVTAWAFAAAGLGAGLGLTVAVVYGLLALVASLPGAAVLAARAVARRRPAPVARPATALVEHLRPPVLAYAGVSAGMNRSDRA
ncbi:lysylphosphatidylglycerol synthase transmembrane domain-containing protein [Spirilliplanes yamanashiensis]|uniref:Uncharacterized protein n=1 Tax=Spirilliplanes yamanashiensis TaxID=42233 RepID=A0A8J3YB94_9ACTN|nr:lysylphosphatidylglycerol synthase transmembrane domain-containing protein [Spirilliplanes yamanashiensis]MDP9819071.1 uncharacterized membrane protein YbhN (UPF0104 family) [Spirilliplanes yamanashiensis]GIJ05526.1 hypothetical protein Sya03_48780 [Spirilliplanes yamanashiensis]